MVAGIVSLGGDIYGWTHKPVPNLNHDGPRFVGLSGILVRMRIVGASKGSCADGVLIVFQFSPIGIHDVLPNPCPDLD